MTIQQQYDELPQAVKDRFETSWAAHPSVINLQIRIEDAKMKRIIRLPYNFQRI